MSYSSIKADLDKIAEGITSNDLRVKQALEILQTVADDYAEYPTRYSNAIAEIGAYTGADATEDLAAAELSKFVSEYTAITAKVNAAIGSLE